jgi:two-component system cell cycle response regulator DivK
MSSGAAGRMSRSSKATGCKAISWLVRGVSSGLRIFPDYWLEHDSGESLVRLPRRNGWGYGSGMTKKVLIVEDNELNMKLFHDLLDAQGYETLQTREGLSALALAREHRPDLILMDIQLPEISGLEVTKWLKEDDDLAHIPVVAVTAFAMKGDEERIREGGCEAYISKPISVVHFLDTIRRLLG